MLERASMSDRIKSVMGLLRRYEALFSLPTRIMQETDRGDFDTVSNAPRCNPDAQEATLDVSKLPCECVNSRVCAGAFAVEVTFA